MVIKMRKNVKVWITVTCDQHPDEVPDEKIMIKVKDTVADIIGITKTYLSPGSAKVGAFAFLDEDKIPLLKEEIEKIDNVTEVEIMILVPVN